MAQLTLRVQPNAKTQGIQAIQGDVITVRVTAPAREGRANQALLELLAELLKVPRSRLFLLRGHTARYKMVEVVGVTQEEAMRRLAASTRSSRA